MTRPGRYHPESDGGDTHERKGRRTFYVVDSGGELSRIDCKSLREAEHLAELMNLSPDELEGVLSKAWEDGYVTESFLTAMKRVAQMILETDTNNTDRAYGLERATAITGETGILILFATAFLKRILPDRFSLDDMMLQVRNGLISAQREALWKAWKEEPDA